MTRLVKEAAAYVRNRMQVDSLSLPSDGALRSVFHGPPLRFLRPLLDELTADGGIEARLASGELVLIPVLLPLTKLEGDTTNPLVGSSGQCDENYVLRLRNTPGCPRFLTLTAPARHSVLSVVQATVEFGVSAEVNGGSVEISDWWRDGFVQSLVDSALERTSWQDDSNRQQARRLLERAVRAADEADRHAPQRPHAWSALSRALSVADPALALGTQWSLACGFPPLSDGSVNFEEQSRVLEHLAEALVDEGFTPCIERLKRGANPAEAVALDQCLAHLRSRCEVHSAMAHSAPFYYAPFSEDAVGTPPEWWLLLTADRLADLLEDDSPTEGELEIGCANALLQPAHGLPTVVLDEPVLSLTAPGTAGDPIDATVTREGGGAKNRRAWSIRLADAGTVTDDAFPEHKAPVRYSLESSPYKKAAIRVVSLAHWDPGVIVTSRTAKKVSLPKRAKQGASFSLECSLALTGEGRHFLDVYVSPRVVVAEEARGVDVSSGAAGPGELEASVSQSTPEVFGLEVVATSECYFELDLAVADGTRQVLRIQINCEDAPVQGCKSEFERLIRLNRPNERSQNTVVQVERQTRTADLQGWYLDPVEVAHSCYPIVLADDCRSAWRAPRWGSAEGTVLSRGRFLHDPRPLFEDFAPPDDFANARSEIAKRIRGDEDGYGVVEAAELGSWAKDRPFADLVDQYVRSYFKWLTEEPDIAAWTDLCLISTLESDGITLAQEPDAILVSPLHPLRIGWHCLAQGVLLDAWRAGKPCPAASVLNPDGVPDALALPIRTPGGSLKRVVFLSTDCSSDYWAVLWNSNKLDRLALRSDLPPFDLEFGIQLGGVSSGFSVSQVKRSLDDVATSLLSAKPTINVLVTSSSGHSDACNEGLMLWARDRFAEREGESPEGLLMGPRQLQIFDERKHGARPEDAAVANLTEDTAGAAKWFGAMPLATKPDLGIIAQLETSNPSAEPNEVGSPVGFGALIRHRVRTQLRAGAGAFLSESRMGVALSPSGHGLADLLTAAIVRLENLGDTRYGYTFAPSVQAIGSLLQTKQAEFVAVSSAAVDPACFLGGWLEDMYLWDYELPSYSHRAGDTNGYYLLSRVRPIDCETLAKLLARLPGCEMFDGAFLEGILLEVARRGIPTVRGLSANHSGASGDLGLFLAGRLLQDEFRASDIAQSILPVLAGDVDVQEIALVIPVDPFRGYLSDLHNALGLDQFLRPDLVVVGIVISDSSVRCRFTPIEVKYRRDETMSAGACQDALSQARCLSGLMQELIARGSQQELVLWKLALQHLLLSIIDFGFRVYSQQLVAANSPRDWSGVHQRVVSAVLSEDLILEIDPTGRLIVFDGSPTSAPRDVDGDDFRETIVISAPDAAQIVRGLPEELYAAIRGAVGDWGLFPEGTSRLESVRARTQGAQVRPAGVSTAAPVPPPTDDDPLTPDAPQADLHQLKPVAAEATPEAKQSTEASVKSPQFDKDEGLKILVGHSASGFRSESKFLCPSKTALNQLNMGVVGDLGTGKTQLVKSLIYQIRKGAEANGGVQPRFLIFDYKKDYSSDDFVEAVGAKVVVPHNLPLNLFDISGVSGQTVPWLNRFKFFADVLDKIFSNVGPVQRENLKQAVRAAYEESAAIGKQPTIYDVHDRYRARLNDKTDAPLSIIGDIVDMELFAKDASGAEGFDKFVDGVVVLSLDALGQDDHTKNMLVAIMLNMFYEHMLRLTKRPYRGTDPQLRTVDSYLLVDEADNIMRYEFDVLRKILLQGREFGVGVILASQYLRHFKAGATDYREPLLSWFIHKVPNISAQELSALGLVNGGAQLADQIKELPNHHCLFKTFDVPGEIVMGEPFYKILGNQ